MTSSNFNEENYSENLSDIIDSDNNQKDNLNIGKIRDEINNLENKITNDNRTQILINKNKNVLSNLSEISSANHMTIEIKKDDMNNKKIKNENKLIILSNSERIDNESINSSYRKSFKFLNYFPNNLMMIHNIRKSFGSNSYNNSESDRESIKLISNCLVCEEILKEEEKKNNFLDCFHIVCDDCYYEYLKEKINNNQIDRIRCLQKGCDIILNTNFIERKLIRDIPLLDKYKKLEARRQLILDKNVQLCPFPDCESYARLENDNKYVYCIENKHKFCFNCLKDWHGDKKCDDNIDKSFEKWRDSYKVKRCPNCKFFIEKNEGCNHITCKNCGYEFCWLCLSKYTSDHFGFGRCAGLQNTECSICSNKIINFIYQLLMMFLKCTAFAICTPFILVFFLYYSFYEECIYGGYRYDCAKILHALGGVLSCLNLIMCGLVFSSFISILMLFIWPLQDAIFSLIK